MGLRLGPGPVFVYEWLTATRRRQLYAMRALFVGLILVGMMPGRGRPESAPDGRVTIRELAEYGEGLFRLMVLLEVTLILLAAPTATAGAVCVDKARGTLDHMLTTDLSSSEIVLGKLGVRLIPVLGLIGSALPVAALSTLLGGIDPLALVGLFLVAIGCAVLGCSLALTLSVFGRKTHEVLVLTYMILAAWIAALPIVEIAYEVAVGPPPGVWTAANVWTLLHNAAEWSNPFVLALAPYERPGTVGIETYAGFLTGCLLGSAALTGLATARIRGVALSQVGRPARPSLRQRLRLVRPSWLPRLPGPSLDRNPVAWREWHRSRPTLMMRVAWGLYAALGLFWLWVVLMPTSGPLTEKVAIVNTVQVTIGLFLLSTGAATSLAEERARGSLDVLLSTPMSTRSILMGKWWGSYRRILSVAIWPALLSIPLLQDGGSWVSYFALLGLVLAYGAAITSLGLALATWVRRTGRAVALCVSIHVGWMVVWAYTVAFLFGPPAMDHVGMMIGVPPVGGFAGTLAISWMGFLFPGGPALGSLVPSMIAWIAVIGGFAALLFLATLVTFDACLGRNSNRADRQSSGRPPRQPRPMPAAGPPERVLSTAAPSRMEGTALPEVGRTFLPDA